MKKICYVSLRGSIVYDGMGSHTIDGLCEICKNWIEERNDKYEFSYHRVDFFGKKNPKRNLDSISQANVIVILSFKEFLYHIKGRVGGWEFRRSWNDLLDIRKLINPKKQVVWLFSSDNRDNVELYKNYVFPKIPIKIIPFDENLREKWWSRNGVERKDYLGNVYSLKLNWIKGEYDKWVKKHKGNPPPRKYDFIYWGSSKHITIGGKKVKEKLYRGWGKEKYDYRDFTITEGIESGDDRGVLLREIKKDKTINSLIIGIFKGEGFSADIKKWMDMKDVLPYLFQSKYSICFNWNDDGENLTSRLYECLGSGVQPILVGDYDKNKLIETYFNVSKEYDITDYKPPIRLKGVEEVLQFLKDVD